MEREILFRGKRDYNGEWLYGDLLSHAYERPNIRPVNDVNNYPVIPQTVGQYTSLNDKNGVKIFEGDIVEVLNPDPFINTTGVVVYNDGCFDVEFYRRDIVRDYLKCLVCNWACRVIGNIHDNPELLEEKENG